MEFFFSPPVNLISLGSKASNLFVMRAASITVPAFFVIPPATLSTISSDDEVALSKALAQLGGKAFAIRSSSTVEDSAARSWAGMFLTELGVSATDVPSAIERCWNSAKTHQVESYGNGEKNIQMAVIVQVMIDPLIAGVAFSKHPVTQNAQVIVIEAVEGLGDKLVQGEAEPSTSIVDLESRKTIESFGPELFPSSNSKLELVNTILQIKKVFGHDIDVEWAIDKNNKLWILQARPITT